MEYEVQTECFKNATLRKEWLKMVMAAFEEAQGHAELICLYQNFEPMITKMRTGGEHDMMVADMIDARYPAFHLRIDEGREWAEKLAREWQDGRQ